MAPFYRTTPPSKSYPAPRQIFSDLGGDSETEVLFPDGATCFASKMGQLAGNHFITIIEGSEHLAALGQAVLWHGVQEILFEGVHR